MCEKDTLCIDGGHSHHQFDVILVGFHAIISTVYSSHFIHKPISNILQFCESMCGMVLYTLVLPHTTQSCASPDFVGID